GRRRLRAESGRRGKAREGAGCAASGSSERAAPRRRSITIPPGPSEEDPGAALPVPGTGPASPVTKRSAGALQPRRFVQLRLDLLVVFEDRGCFVVCCFDGGVRRRLSRVYGLLHVA